MTGPRVPPCPATGGTQVVAGEDRLVQPWRTLSTRIIDTTMTVMTTAGSTDEGT